ncbi:NAD(P)-binding protein [Hyaloscypha variabilis]
MSSTPFRNIALLGATGNLGSKVLAALNNAGFTVTAIQRKESKNTPDGAAKSLKVDLINENDLTSAFRGQDVVVSVMPNPSVATDQIWMKAAIAAGVRRIVPSEFSGNLETELSRQLPIVTDKIEIRKYLEELGQQGKIEWSSINNGPFLIPMIWLSGWIGPGVKPKITTLHDGGERLVCATTLERIGEGLARSLLPEYAEKTKNRAIYVYSTAISERKMTALAEKFSGIKFEEITVSVETVTKEAFEALEQGDTSKTMNFFVPYCFGDGYGGDFRYMASNKELGLEELTEAEQEELVKGWLKDMDASKP